VKTCSKFHGDRLPIIKDTWAQAVSNIMYMSEVTDPQLGTLQLPGSHIMLRDLLIQKCVQNFLVSDFG
jgi:hypothetical protein